MDTHTITHTIENAASEHRWEDAVLSLCNALEALPPQRRLALAREVVKLCEAAKELFTSVSLAADNAQVGERVFALHPSPAADLEPVDVQLESANQILMELGARKSEHDREDVLKLASAISSAVFAVQILMWLQRDEDDVRKWKLDCVPEHGVYDDSVAGRVGEILWKQIHSMIVREKAFRGRSEDFIYRARPIESLARSWLDEQLL
ncbi:MAG TPA: hypothetical protein VGG99_28895 [Acetobacteraceae bacterium]|jgi:hypothetical protein